MNLEIEKAPVTANDQSQSEPTNVSTLVQSPTECQYSSPITTAEQANAAHRRIVGTVQDAIAIGEFLTAKKAELGHGNWLPWLKANIEFDQKTAWNYANLYANRSKLGTVPNLQAAYKLLAAPVKDEEPKPRTPKPANVETQPVTVEAEVVSQENLPAIDVAAPETTFIANVVSRESTTENR